MNQDEHKKRVAEAMRRFYMTKSAICRICKTPISRSKTLNREAQETRPAGRQRPLLRRKNNFVRGSMEIFCAGMSTTVDKKENRGANNGQ